MGCEVTPGHAALILATCMVAPGVLVFAIAGAGLVVRALWRAHIARRAVTTTTRGASAPHEEGV